jgi:general secretion pathway protein D
VLFITAALLSIPRAVAQEEMDDPTAETATREEILDRLEEHTGDLFDFRPSRQGDSDSDPRGEEPPRRSKSRSKSRDSARRAGTPVVPQSASRTVDAESSSALKVNFDGMDLLEFLQLMSEIRDDLNFIVHPDINSASVTIKSSKAIKKEDVPDVIQTVLEINGLAAIPSGRYYKIVPMKDSPQYNVETRTGKSLEDIPTDDRLITQIVPLEHIAAGEMSNVLNDFVSGQGRAIVAHEGTNTLIISSSASSIRRMLRIIERLDVPSNTSQDNLFVYYLENAEAETLAKVLNDLYPEEDRRRSSNSRSRTTRSRTSTRTNRRTGSNRRDAEVANSRADKGAARFTGAAVVPYNDINALIIKTTPRNYENIKRTIALLDIEPKQVFIEMLIAEISLDEDTQFGIEWSTSNTFTSRYGGRDHTYQQGFSRGTARRDSSSVFDGFRYMLSETNRLRAVLEARAAESKLNVLASPNIVASDNKEAEIAVTDEVPIQQSTITETGVERLSFQYRDAGIKLKITPNINEKGVVALELDQEVSEISGSTANGQPTFVTRTAKTTVSVRDGQTLAIGGLIQESETATQAGIPILSKIPILGYLFRSSGTRQAKTELVILITPHVITSMEDGDSVTRAFTGRMSDLKESVDQSMAEIAERTKSRGDVSYRVGDQGAVLDFGNEIDTTAIAPEDSIALLPPFSTEDPE